MTIIVQSHVCIDTYDGAESFDNENGIIAHRQFKRCCV
jgi:hypothetical protein